MFSTGTPVGNIQPYFLTQVVPEQDLDPAKQLDQQPQLAAITGQAQAVADVFAGFIGAAAVSLDIAIYDFRLLPGALTDTIAGAVRDAAGRGVAVRLAYDKTQETDDEATLKAFAGAGGDPAPTGTHLFIARAFGQPALGEPAALPSNLQVQPILEEGIDPGHPAGKSGHIMHQKYIVRDAGTSAAAVLTGSANYTTDAWGIQENNLLAITEATDLAAAYEQDFTDLWSTKKLAGTGQHDLGQVTVGGIDIAYSFAPGEGAATETAIAALVAGATRRIRVASMVLSSPKILRALVDQINAGRDVAGIYDGPEMAGVVEDWKKFASSAATLALWQQVQPRLVAKKSVPFEAETIHNFMHNKVVVADDTVSTGSFNLSKNATGNAENVLRISSAELARQYAAYVDDLVQQYGAT
jgi:phosphatidylserine/phosphatidylglycerophosphate/cardiolipin synthase-like enzyme